MAVVLSNYGSGAQPVGTKIRGLIQSCTDCQIAKN